MDFKFNNVASRPRTENDIGIYDLIEVLLTSWTGGVDKDYGLHYLLDYVLEVDTVKVLATFDWEDGYDPDQLIIDSHGYIFYSSGDGDNEPMKSYLPIQPEALEQVLAQLKEKLTESSA